MHLEAKSSRALLLICCTLSYLLLGAAVFGRLESEAEAELREQIRHVRATLHDKDLELFQTVAIKSLPHKAGSQWSFAGSFYFATVMITTVGYGHSAPETMGGKLACMLYGLFGIPLGLVMFQSIGERVNTAISAALHKTRRRLRVCGWRRLPAVSVSHILAVSLSFGFSLIGVSTYVFHKEEKWSLFDAFYFCFITLSTIGLGDLVAVQGAEALERRPGYLLFTLLFIVLGLALFSACVNLLVLKFMAPNADEVTAAARDAAQPSVVFEHFAHSASTLNLFGIRKSSKESRPSTCTRPSESAVLPPSPRIFSKVQESTVSSRQRNNSPCCLLGCACCIRKPGTTRKEKPKRLLRRRSTRVHFTIRRLPAESIEHLLHEAADDDLLLAFSQKNHSSIPLSTPL